MMSWTHRRLTGLVSMLLLLVPMGYMDTHALATDRLIGTGSHAPMTMMKVGMQAEEPFTVEVMPVVAYPGVDVNGSIMVFDSDLASTTYEITTPPRQGSATIEPGVMWGDFVYSPNADASGEDSFVVTISDDPGTGPRSIEVVVDVTIRPQVTITDLTCEGELTYTVGEGEWGDESQLMTFRITSPLPEYPLIKAQMEVPHAGPGDYTIALDVRPDVFSDLTATGPGGSTLSIGECDPGGNPDLEPWAEIEITELSCEDGVVFTIGEGYFPPNIHLSIKVEGHYLDGDKVSASEELAWVGLEAITEGRAIQIDTDLRAADFDQILVTIESGSGSYRETALFDTCDSDPLPYEGTPSALTNRRG